MKILKIKIEKTRGLVDFECEPSGKSMAISGPNGSGKSAFVDAVDFLLTGSIARLTGKGAGELSLKEHGPHIDHEPKDAIVTAEVILSTGKKYKIQRRISEPSKWSCNPEPDEDIRQAMLVAERGYHVLSRREVLKYIAQEPSTRAQEVQALLNLDKVESLRKILLGASKDAEKAEDLRDIDVKTLQVEIAKILGLSSYTESAVLAGVNSCRATLQGNPLQADDLGSPKKDLRSIEHSQVAISKPVSVGADVARLKFDKEVIDVIRGFESQLKERLREVHAEPDLAKEIEYCDLIETGISLLGDASHCPLCQKEWNPDELKKFLAGRKARAGRAGQIYKQINEHSRRILERLTFLETILPRLAQASESLGDAATRQFFDEWLARWKNRKTQLESPIDKYPDATGESIIEDCVVVKGAEEKCAALLALAEKTNPKPSDKQLAWDTLTKFEVAWGSFVRAQRLKDEYARRKSIFQALLTEFEKSRDSLLGGLYKEIETAFTAFYKELHEHEGEAFEAQFKPDGPKLRLEVDFHGRGKYPPTAVHSEGHQDSMGLCLYLALMEKLTQGLVKLTVLDDVVMSVDAEHRRPICELLIKKFPDRQFLITTHDKHWARQIRNLGLVPPPNCVAFRQWTVEEGPKWQEENHWLDIQKKIDRDIIPEAAAALRREVEEFFENVCDSLAAPVPYSGDGKYEKSDLVSAAVGRLGKLLGKAKNSETSWEHKDKVAEIEKRESVFDEAKKKTQIEDWIINENVHYNRWIQSSKNDFRPVYEAFVALRDCFKCNKCDTILYVMPRKHAESLRCRCGGVTMNLIADKQRTQAVVSTA